MPIYEYRCQACGIVSSFFTRSISAALEPVCQRCQSRDMQRRMSPFSMGKYAASGQGASSPGAGHSPLDDYVDPRNIGRNVEESFVRHGVEMPDSVRETIDAARQGQLPKGLDV